MKLNKIDWNKIWHDDFAEYAAESLPSDHWNNRAEGFNEWAGEDAYTQLLLGLLDFDRSYTVLDVGCGAGNITIPLAKKVKYITALDYAPKMVDCVAKNAQKAGLTNVDTICSDWHKTIIGKDINIHDIVISSCALITTDLKLFVSKLNEAAKVSVFISWQVSQPFYDGVYASIGKQRVKYPDYSIIYNLLVSMRIFANITMFESVNQISYQNLEQAVTFWRWKTGGFTPVEEKRLKIYLADTLEEKNGQWQPKQKMASKWALFSWNK